AALAGDLDGALQWADTALADEAAPDRARAAGVAAAVLAQRGLLTRAAGLCRLAGAEWAGSAALALLATGQPDTAATVLEAARSSPGLPTVLSVSEELTAQGGAPVAAHGEDAAADIAAALSTLTRAAALLEPVGRTALLVDSPAALAALVALHSGELGVAESVLQRAVDADLGGPPCRRRHRLLLAWIAMLAGRVSRRASRSSGRRKGAGRSSRATTSSCRRWRSGWRGAAATCRGWCARGCGPGRRWSDTPWTCSPCSRWVSWWWPRRGCGTASGCARTWPRRRHSWRG
ncbi:MAG: hypothetical protein M3Q47_19085, partial [Actinomycetota bacterium]|nr:hypothetical protein [Actinomycetota bacterium]